jgi:hypothetical protein
MLLAAGWISLAAIQPACAGKTHLFILSGQSNMAGLKPEVSFTPTVTEALADDTAIVLKDAQGGQPIRRWYKAWKPKDGTGPAADGALYDQLLKKVKAAVGDTKPDTVTFVWMQGERDAKEEHGEVYAASLEGLLAQLAADLGRKDINFVIGRLSDCQNTPHWRKVREAQVAVADASDRGAWVDTDDLNGPKDGLHYTKEGYKELGKRFAEQSLELIRKHQ